VEGLDFGETFALVAHLEAIRILLTFATSKGFKLYQMGMKSAFQNGVIREEVYVRQPQVLRILTTQIECTSSQRLCTGLSKHRGLGMLGLKYFC
jgi:acetolactate synthase regulatory subunit